jgi:hypothetical protein
MYWLLGEWLKTYSISFYYSYHHIVFKSCGKVELCFTKPFFGLVKLCIAGKEVVEVNPD